METTNWKELAIEQFYDLKQQIMSDPENEDVVGSTSTEDYEIPSIGKVSITVDGFWEKVVHFDYVVLDLNNNNKIVEEGKYSN